ncbi:hypothetical protein VE03_05675 [Pseudogymnoascus sp. 23342-1-I1]|nr:hypothetical protein VE03_05675 [Pseudogymnoascus sp. 23342-1-I1]
MAPSVAQVEEVQNASITLPTKTLPLTTKQTAVENPAAPAVIETTKPNITRQIDKEGGTTTAKYPHYLPVSYHSATPPSHAIYPHRARHARLPPSPSSHIHNLTPSTGSNSPPPDGKSQLALLAATRKVVTFLNQDFADLPIATALEFGGYFGRHHVHTTGSSP